MANVISQSQLDRYLIELAKDEATLAADVDEYETVKSRVEMGMRRYQALRDFVAERIGENPYTQSVRWPQEAIDHLIVQPGEDYPERGRFRYTGMRMGDAIVAVLRDAHSRGWASDEGWMTLSDVVGALGNGGFGFPEPVQLRAVNAALRNTTGVLTGVRPDKVRMYRVAVPGTDAADPLDEDVPSDPDDLPFE